MLEQYIGYAYLFLAAIGFAYMYSKSREKARMAAKGGWTSFRGVALTFVGVFGLVGLLDAFIPLALIEKLLGSQALAGESLEGMMDE